MKLVMLYKCQLKLAWEITQCNMAHE